MGFSSSGSGKNLPANAGDTRDPGLIPRLGRSPGEEHDNPIQYSCLENPMDRGAWGTTVHMFTKSNPMVHDQSNLVRRHSCTCMYTTSFISIHLWMDFWVVSISWPL